jgi:hypothetical protein
MARAPVLIDREKFIESVYHVIFFGNTVRHFECLFMSAAGKLSRYESMILRYSIQWNVLLITNSLFDELKKYLFSYVPEDIVTGQKITDYKHMVGPAIDEISSWPDIRRFRNNVLAHNFRDDNDNFRSVHLSNRLEKYDVPSTTIDLIVLFKLLDVITKIAAEIFRDEYNEALAIVDRFEKKERIPQTMKEEFAKANLVLKEMQNRIDDYNRS